MLTTPEYNPIRPRHYGNNTVAMQPIEFINLFGLDFARGNVIKYLYRAGEKPGVPVEQDIQKAIEYLRLVPDDNEPLFIKEYPQDAAAKLIDRLNEMAYDGSYDEKLEKCFNKTDENLGFQISQQNQVGRLYNITLQFMFNDKLNGDGSEDGEYVNIVTDMILNLFSTSDSVIELPNKHLSRQLSKAYEREMLLIDEVNRYKEDEDE